MKNVIKYLSAAVLLSCVSYGQNGNVDKANKEYEKCAYVDAVKVYEKALQNGYKSADMLKKLGNAYYFQANYENASKWYEELFSMPDLKEADYYYRYAQSLKATGNYDKADQILKEFAKNYKDDSRANMAQQQQNYLEVIKKNLGNYNIANADFNSDKLDFGSAVLGEKVVFASARDKNQIDPWSGQYCTDLFEAEIKEDGTFGKVSKFGGDINTKYNESTPVFTKDGNTVYFTRNNYINGKKGADKNNITLLKLYKATYDGENWKDIKELPFNSNEYSVAHPALSPDEKTLYFVSNMPGTIGESDIFKVNINGSDRYGKPVNLGPGINTEGRESFPFVTDKNEIYFSSDGYPGLGGLDVFVGTISDNGTVKEVQNVGADINSAKDDFAFVINTATGKGFFSSNKDGGKGSDDIYSFEQIKKQKCEEELSGIITDAYTGETLVGTKVSLLDSNNVIKSSVLTNEAGMYKFTVDCGKFYNVRFEKAEYATKEAGISMPSTTGQTKPILSIGLDLANCKVAVGDNLGKCFGIKRIHFNVDKFNINHEAAVDLEKILIVMKENPDVTIDVRSYTDSRASAEYNQALSDRRAKSTIQWLVNNGIAKNRLTGKGYGETQLVNGCSDGVSCTEEEHLANRRSEFIITKI